MNQGLAAIDWLVLAAYAGLTLWLGWYYGRRQSSTKEYFIGGAASIRSPSASRCSRRS